MTWTAQPLAQEMCFETLNKTLELGANFWNGGELYGTPTYNSLHLLNKYFTKYPENAEKVVLSIKGGLKVGEIVADGSEENIRRSVEETLRVLDGKKKVDIFECARQDKEYPVEHSVRILAEYVKAGKIGGIGLSEVDAETIRRAYVILTPSIFYSYLPCLQTQGPPHRGRRDRVVTLVHGQPEQWGCAGLRRAQHPHCGLLAPGLGHADGRREVHF